MTDYEVGVIFLAILSGVTWSLLLAVYLRR